MRPLSKLGINCVFILFLLPISAFSQENEMGNWLMYFGTNKVSEKFSIHTEVQFRNHTFFPNNTEQLLLRTGLNFSLSKKAIVTAGYAYIPSYIFQSEQKSPETKEHRIWQQFILTNKLGILKFEHRYRIEQRWVDRDFKTRFRYRLLLLVPINKQVVGPGCLFFAFYDEIFINKKQTFFDRNRLYGALGYQLDKDISIQTGILHQQVNDFGKWYLQLALAISFDHGKTGTH